MCRFVATLIQLTEQVCRTGREAHGSTRGITNSDSWIAPFEKTESHARLDGAAGPGKSFLQPGSSILRVASVSIAAFVAVSCFDLRPRSARFTFCAVLDVHNRRMERKRIQFPVAPDAGTSAIAEVNGKPHPAR
jgi:hypothetical protein